MLIAIFSEKLELVSQQLISIHLGSCFAVKLFPVVCWIG